MDIWFKINVIAAIALAVALIMDRLMLIVVQKANGEGEPDDAAPAIAGLLAWFLIFSWPAYWLSLLWA